RLVLFIGSTIGNLEETESSDLLRRISQQLGPHDRLLLGTDLVKDVNVLPAADNDAAGVTARFNRNVLARLNPELGGDFDLPTFTHRAIWNARRSRMEMHLVSSMHQQAWIRDLGLRVAFARGEGIHTENSYKYTLPSLCSLLMRSGLQIEKTWL